MVVWVHTALHSLAALEDSDSLTAPVASAFFISAASLSSACLLFDVDVEDILFGQRMAGVTTV